MSKARRKKSADVYDLAIIGGGPAGIVAAKAARRAKLGARIVMIESGQIGGSSLATGSIPSKTMVRAAQFYADQRYAHRYGASIPQPTPIDFARLKKHISGTQEYVANVLEVNNVLPFGAEIRRGAARFTAANAITLDDETLHFDKAIIATGSRAAIAPITGLTETGYHTSDTIFSIDALPKRLLVVGGGPLGCEMAQTFARLGCYVIIAQQNPMFLAHEERDAAQLISDALVDDGVEVHLNSEVTSVRCDGTQKIAQISSYGMTNDVPIDEILLCVGRAPNIENLGLETARVQTCEYGIRVDDYLRTSNPHIYAAGDCCLPHKFANTARAAGWTAGNNAMSRKRHKLEEFLTPWCTYTDPQIAHVGLHVWGAWAADVPIKTYTALMHDNDRAIIAGADRGFVKIHLKDGTDEILGATIVANRASELINSITLAMNAGVGLRALARSLHAYPTEGDAIRVAAEAYLAAHPEPQKKPRKKKRK